MYPIYLNAAGFSSSVQGYNWYQKYQWYQRFQWFQKYHQYQGVEDFEGVSGIQRLMYKLCSSLGWVVCCECVRCAAVCAVVFDKSVVF